MCATVPPYSDFLFYHMTTVRQLSRPASDRLITATT